MSEVFGHFFDSLESSFFSVATMTIFHDDFSHNPMSLTSFHNYFHVSWLLLKGACFPRVRHKLAISKASDPQHNYSLSLQTRYPNHLPFIRGRLGWLKHLVQHLTQTFLRVCWKEVAVETSFLQPENHLPITQHQRKKDTSDSRPMCMGLWHTLSSSWVWDNSWSQDDICSFLDHLDIHEW